MFISAPLSIPHCPPSGSAPRVVCMHPREQHPPMTLCPGGCGFLLLGVAVSSSVRVWGYTSVSVVCVCLWCCLSACSCGHVCPCCYPENLPGHTMGGSLRVRPWLPAQPNSQASVLTLLPGPGLTPACRLHSQRPPNGCSLTASTSGLSSPVYTQQCEGSSIPQIPSHHPLLQVQTPGLGFRNRPSGSGPG